MKEWSLLIWLTQLGISFILPLALFVLLGEWLHRDLGWGKWTIWAGLMLGFAGSARNFRESLRAMERMQKAREAPDFPRTGHHDHR